MDNVSFSKIIGIALGVLVGSFLILKGIVFTFGFLPVVGHFLYLLYLALFSYLFVDPIFWVSLMLSTSVLAFLLEGQYFLFSRFYLYIQTQIHFARTARIRTKRYSYFKRNVKDNGLEANDFQREAKQVIK